MIPSTGTSRGQTRTRSAITLLVVFALPLLGILTIEKATDPVPAFERLLYAPVRTGELARVNPGSGSVQVSETERSMSTTGFQPDSELAVAVRPSDALVPAATSLTPVGLKIPSIDVDGAVIPVGLSPDSILDVPLPNTGGWYEHSVAPGERGATVVAAHADLNGETALFFELRNLQPGQDIVVQLSDGSEARYVVDDVVLYDKTELAQTSLFRQQGEHALHLITCGGTFDQEQRSYRGNTVVIATPAAT